jgi:hypothetical protein
LSGFNGKFIPINTGKTVLFKFDKDQLFSFKFDKDQLFSFKFVKDQPFRFKFDKDQLFSFRVATWVVDGRTDRQKCRNQ